MNDARYHQAALEQLEIIKTSFQCDLTRVASFSFGWGNLGIRFSSVVHQCFFVFGDKSGGQGRYMRLLGPAVPALGRR